MTNAACRVADAGGDWPDPGKSTAAKPQLRSRCVAFARDAVLGLGGVVSIFAASWFSTGSSGVWSQGARSVAFLTSGSSQADFLATE